jgi:hypothetical protein
LEKIEFFRIDLFCFYFLKVGRKVEENLTTAEFTTTTTMAFQLVGFSALTNYRKKIVLKCTLPFVML